MSHPAELAYNAKHFAQAINASAPPTVRCVVIMYDVEEKELAMSSNADKELAKLMLASALRQSKLTPIIQVNGKP